MNRLPLSPSASALLRALIRRAGVPRDRILLADLQSADWCSLTLTGERHVLELRVPGSDGRSILECMCADLEDAEFAIPGIVVADLAVTRGPTIAEDGSATVTIEALMVAAD